MPQIGGQFRLLHQTIQAMMAKRVQAITNTHLKGLLYDVEGDGSQNYGFLGELPTMLDLTRSELVAKSFAEYDWNIKNKAWGTAVNIPEIDLSRDAKANKGVLRTKIRQMANAPQRHLRSYSVALIEAGNGSTYGTGFDGQNFYSTTHSWNKSEYTTSQSNLITHSIVDKDDPTQAEMNAAFDVGRDALMLFKDDQGEIWHDSPKSGLVVWHPVNHMKFFEVMLQNRRMVDVDGKGAALENRLEGAAGLHTEPRFSATDAFYIFKTDDFVSALLMQWEKVFGQRFRTGNVRLDDSEVVNTGKVKFWGKGRYNLGYFLWPYSVKVQLATA